MKSIDTHHSVLAPRHPRGRRRWLYAAIALVLLGVVLQLGMAVRHYRENAAYVALLDRAKYGGGMRTTHSTGRVHDAIAVVADTQFGPLPAIGDWLQETWWLLGEPIEIKIAGPGVPLEEALSHVAGSPDVEQVSLFTTRSVVGDELRHLDDCDRLTTIYLRDVSLLPNALRHVSACETLKRLDLSHSTGVDDEAIAALRTLAHLERLDLKSTAVTDVGLAHISHLRLTFLDLTDSAVGDASVPVLVQMAPKYLRLDGTRFTASGVAQLRQSLPESDITWSGNSR